LAWAYKCSHNVLNKYCQKSYMPIVFEYKCINEKMNTLSSQPAQIWLFVLLKWCICHCPKLILTPLITWESYMLHWLVLERIVCIFSETTILMLRALIFAHSPLQNNLDIKSKIRLQDQNWPCHRDLHRFIMGNVF
jgi:hypothetical protein